MPQNAMLQVPTLPTKIPASQSKRRVRFSEAENDSQSAPNKELTAEMKQEMWYTSTEISGFKKEAKCIIAQRYFELQTGVKTVDSENALGLERYEPKRDEFKRQAIYFTLQAQNKSKDPEFIRMIYHKCTAYSRAVASHQVLSDYGAAYDPLYSLDTQGKRQQRDSDDCEQPRNKKQRTAIVA